MRGIGIIANHFQREIRFHAGAHVEIAFMKEWPAAVLALNTPQIIADLGFADGVCLLAQIMHQQNIFGGDRCIGLELEAPVPIFTLRLQKSRCCGPNAAFELFCRRLVFIPGFARL